MENQQFTINPYGVSKETSPLEGLKAELRRESRRARLNFEELKSGGYIKQTQKDLFTVRLRCPGGRITADKLRMAAEIAERYGRGYVHLSVRQSIEVPYVHHADFEAIQEMLKEVNWSIATCGPRVRVPTACSGCEYNPNGLGDTQGLCQEVDRRFFGMPTGHHKFKISFSGCPIDCFRTREMDLGFQAMVKPQLDEAACNGCTLCVRACEDQALKMQGPLPVRDDSRCIECGDCIKVCPVGAMRSQQRGWLVRVGGRHGKHPLFAYEVAKHVSDEQVFTLIERTLAWYQENGEGRERIGATLERVGLNRFVEEVIRPIGVQVIDSEADRRAYWTGGNFYGPARAQPGAKPEAPARSLTPPALDCRGAVCPSSFVLVKQALDELEPGAVLEVQLDDGEPLRSVSKGIKDEGHRILSVQPEADGSLRLRIERGRG